MGALLTLALLGGGLASLGAAPATAGAQTSLTTAARSTVTSPKFVSAAVTGKNAACTVADIRATNRWWISGHNSQLDFGVSGNAAPTPSRASGVAVEGSTVVTDTQGNLRFWSNGIDVWGADGQPIKNSGGGKGQASAVQTVVAMPALGAPGKYYVVTTGYQAEMGGEAGHLYYSVIDMNLNGGKGEMTQKNIPLGHAGVAGEGLSATMNAAGDGYWVYSLGNYDSLLYRWEFKANGPTSTTPIAQRMSDVFASFSSINFDNSRGSNKGVIVAAHLNIYTLVTVNRTTGELTEGYRVKHDPISGRGFIYGTAFSADGRYLYFSEIYGSPSSVYRVDTHQPSAEAMFYTRLTVGTLANIGNSGGGVKLGPDGNIWVVEGHDVTTLGKIANASGAVPGPGPGAMQHVSLSAGGNERSGWALPDMVTGCEMPVPQLTATLSAPGDLTLGDAISPVTLTLTNTGNTTLTEIASPFPVLNACPQTTLAAGASMSCTVTAGTHWGSVTQAQNDAGKVVGLAYPISATGPVGADPATGAPRFAVISVAPTMDLPIVITRTLTFDPTGGTLSGPASLRRANGLAWGTLPTATTTAKVFLGWHTAATGGTQITSSSVATKDLTVFAQWRPANFNVVFYPNPEMGTVTGATPSMSYDSGCTDCLLPANGFIKSTGAPELIDHDTESAEVNSAFLGWSLDPTSRVGDIADRAVAGALSQTDGATVRLYAIWDDAPQFIIHSYPDRLFNLAQAHGGTITEAELLRTVRATDRETKPLATKTSEQIASSGSDVGITLYDYDAGDFTSLTDSGMVTVTYKVKDEASHVAFLRIRVTVTDDAALGADAVQYLRGISPQYAGSDASEGGFPADSLWLTDPTRVGALERALSGETAVTYCLDADAVTTLREQARTGLGGSAAPDGLATAAGVLREGGSCS